MQILLLRQGVRASVNTTLSTAKYLMYNCLIKMHQELVRSANVGANDGYVIIKITRSIASNEQLLQNNDIFDRRQKFKLRQIII